MRRTLVILAMLAPGLAAGTMQQSSTDSKMRDYFKKKKITVHGDRVRRDDNGKGYPRVYEYFISMPFTSSLSTPLEPPKETSSANECSEHEDVCLHGTDCGVHAKATLTLSWTSQEILTNSESAIKTTSNSMAANITNTLSGSFSAQVGVEAELVGVGVKASQTITAGMSNASQTGTTTSVSNAVQTSTTKSISQQQTYSNSVQADVPPCTTVTVTMFPALTLSSAGTFHGSFVVTIAEDDSVTSTDLTGEASVDSVVAAVTVQSKIKAKKTCGCKQKTPTESGGGGKSGDHIVPVGFENALYVPSTFPTTTAVTVGTNERLFPASSNVTVKRDGDKTTTTDLVTGTVVTLIATAGGGLAFNEIRNLNNGGNTLMQTYDGQGMGLNVKPGDLGKTDPANTVVRLENDKQAFELRPTTKFADGTTQYVNRGDVPPGKMSASLVNTATRQTIAQTTVSAVQFYLIVSPETLRTGQSATLTIGYRGDWGYPAGQMFMAYLATSGMSVVFDGGRREVALQVSDKQILSKTAVAKIQAVTDGTADIKLAVEEKR